MKVSLALPALAFALALLLLWQWWYWPPPAVEPSSVGHASAQDGASSGPAEDPADLLSPLGDKEDYVNVTERPLFVPDRRPPIDEPGEEGPQESELPSDLARMDLNAVLITPSESSAWIRDPAQKKLVRLRPGDELSGWSVQEILSDRVLLERQGDTDTLVLRDYKNMPPPAPPRRTPATRKPPHRPSQSGTKRSRSAPNVSRPGGDRPGRNRPGAK